VAFVTLTVASADKAPAGIRRLISSPSETVPPLAALIFFETLVAWPPPQAEQKIATLTVAKINKSARVSGLLIRNLLLS
jgi:hypothetical protein